MQTSDAADIVGAAADSIVASSDPLARALDSLAASTNALADAVGAGGGAGGGTSVRAALADTTEIRPLRVTDAATGLLAKLEGWVDAVVLYLPNFVAAVLIVVLAAVIARVVRRLVTAVLHRVTNHAPQATNVVDLLATVSYVVVMLAGTFIALGVLNLDGVVTTLLAGAGVVGLALGFAFQDIASNFIAGRPDGGAEPVRAGPDHRDERVHGHRQGAHAAVHHPGDVHRAARHPAERQGLRRPHHQLLVAAHAARGRRLRRRLRRRPGGRRARGPRRRRGAGGAPPRPARAALLHRVRRLVDQLHRPLLGSTSRSRPTFCRRSPTPSKRSRRRSTRPASPSRSPSARSTSARTAAWSFARC